MSNEAREANEMFKADAKKFADRPEIKQERYDDFLKDYRLPSEFVPVPSKGQVYPVGSALNAREELEIASMTAKDEDILTSTALINKGTAINTLVSSCLIDKSVRVGEMLIGDRNAVMIAIRITGYGPAYAVSLNCEGCSKQYQAEFNLTSLPLKRLKIEPVEQFTNKFKFVLPRLKKEVIFKFMTGNDELELSKIIEQSAKIRESTNIITTQLVHSILSIDGIEDKSKISRIVPLIPANDSLALRRFINDNEPGIEMRSFTQCDSCGFSGVADVPIGAGFFWPERPEQPSL